MKYPYRVCGNECRNSQNSIKSDFCNVWTHLNVQLLSNLNFLFSMRIKLFYVKFIKKLFFNFVTLIKPNYFC